MARMKSLDELREYWDSHAQRDPLWAVLSEESKSGGRWDVGRFFETGVHEMASIFYQLDSRHIEVARGAALDFGCGVGRLTQALASSFDRVVGVDVSPRMLALAAAFNRFPSRVSYTNNQRDDLGLFGNSTFDFIVSNIVLQHLPPALALAYIGEFFRVLAPGGILVFQLPSNPRPADDHRPASRAQAMPDESYQASIHVIGVEKLDLLPGAEITLNVAITNSSPSAWSAESTGVMRVGNHWLSAIDSRMLNRDDGRSSLPGLIERGHTCRVPLTITAPSEPGEYRCAIDIAHEGVLWFHDKGSPLITFPVHVHRAGQIEEDSKRSGRSTVTRQAAPEREVDLSSAALAHPDEADPGEFPMHGVHQTTVVNLIASHGGTLLHIEDDSRAGPEWVSFRYYAKR